MTTAGPESRSRGAVGPHDAGLSPLQHPSCRRTAACTAVQLHLPRPRTTAQRGVAGTLDSRDVHGGDGRGGGTRLGHAMQGRTQLGSSAAGAVHSWRGLWRGPKQLETGPAAVPRSQGRAQLERCTAGSLHSWCLRMAGSPPQLDPCTAGSLHSWLSVPPEAVTPGLLLGRSPLGIPPPSLPRHTDVSQHEPLPSPRSEGIQHRSLLLRSSSRFRTHCADVQVQPVRPKPTCWTHRPARAQLLCLPLSVPPI